MAPPRSLRRTSLWAGLFLAGVFVGFEAAWLVGVWQARRDSPSPSPGTVTIAFSATIDGSDRFVFTRNMAYNEHGQWGPARKVVFNDQPWEDLSQPPPGWADLIQNLDLPRATLITRNGRDVIALEPTADGFDIYFADTQMGAADYQATLSIPLTAPRK